ncbi:MAG: DsbA family oxidoreductase [Solirubrobacterales bacterium]
MRAEIWSDIACPWCYVGKRRFERALDQFSRRDEVEVTFRAFQLDPGAPVERTGSYRELLASKYGRSPEAAQQMLDQMTETAAAEGLEFRFDLIRPGNTHDAHRIVGLAATQKLQEPMKERLMRAYLCEGELMSDHDTLTRLAAEVGLASDRVEEVLGSREFAAEVEAEQEEATVLGITAVPFFAFDRQLGCPGAQPAELMVSLLEKAWEQTRA